MSPRRRGALKRRPGGGSEENGFKRLKQGVAPRRLAPRDISQEKNASLVAFLSKGGYSDHLQTRLTPALRDGADVESFVTGAEAPVPRAGTPAPQCGTGVVARQIAENGLEIGQTPGRVGEGRPPCRPFLIATKVMFISRTGH